MRPFPQNKSVRLKFAKLTAGFASAAIVAAAPMVSAQMMMVPGQFGVTPTGASTYTIPIEVPPGTAGMVPALTLNYSSQQGNGLLGVGWSLGGLPSIGRCGKTIAQDEVARGVRFDSEDRFCLDGQKLVAIKGGTYGANNTEYRTEVEGFSKIVSYTETGITGPAKFKVWTKSGQIMEFGYTSNARMVASAQQDVVRSWAVNRILDVKGNYLNVFYDNANLATGEAFPNLISYTGNAGQSISPEKYITFEYQDRPDDHTRYLSGSKVESTKRLKAVKTYVDGVASGFGPDIPTGGTLTKEYKFTYSESAATKRSVLRDVELCAGPVGAQTCLPKTKFDVTTSSFGFEAALIGKMNKTHLNSDQGYSVFPADWNGDGYTDVFSWKGDTGANHWYISDGDGTFTRYDNEITPSAINGGSDGEVLFGDFDGDGFLDIIYRHKPTGSNELYLNESEAFATPGSSQAVVFSPKGEKLPKQHFSGVHADGIAKVADINGDGLADVFWFDGLSGQNRLFESQLSGSSLPNFVVHSNRIDPAWLGYTSSPTVSTETKGLMIGDWNADGRQDLSWQRTLTQMITGSNDLVFEVSIWSFSVDNFQFSTPSASEALEYQSYLSRVQRADYTNDWNGDGVVDAHLFDGSTGNRNFYLNDGDDLHDDIVSPLVTAPFPNQTKQHVTSDFNADGLTDILEFDRDDGHSRFFSNDGEVEFSIKSTTSLDGDSSELYSNTGDLSKIGSIYTGDFDGDGLLDVLWIAIDGTNRLYLNTSTVSDLLETVTTGLGSQTQFVYESGTSASVYTKDTGTNVGTYPSIDFVAPMQLVKEVRAGNGVKDSSGNEGVYRSTYHYTGGKYNAEGRGFLGFRQYKVKDQQTNIEQVTTYKQTFPFIGAVKEDKKLLAAATLNKTTNSYASEAIGTTGEERTFPYISQTVEEATDLDGTAFPTVTTDYVYGDSYGNATKVTVSTPDGASKVTDSTYHNDETKWHIGRLLTAKVTSTVPDVTPSPTGAGAGAAGSEGDDPKPHGVVVVPLNGFTVIPLH